MYSILLAAAAGLWYVAGKKYTAAGILFWGALIALVWILRPFAFLQNKAMAEIREADRLSTLKNLLPIAATFVCVVLMAVLPMKMSPYWNGEYPAHRSQYEQITEAFLKGQLYFEYQPDDILKSLENPYDPNERAIAGANEYSDSSFYNGHYYMYFGVVPVFLVFMPFRFILGHPLAAYHATQLFATGFILGIFALFALLSKRFFSQLSLATYLVMSSAVSFLSIWTAIDTPAMYCTAQVSALMFMVWWLYFFVRAVFDENSNLPKQVGLTDIGQLPLNGEDSKVETVFTNRELGFAFLGSLCGALAIGCRPPVALAGVLLLPLLIVFLRKKKITLPLILKLFVAALPYILVAAGLMWYNYARFDNPFEFGKSYQITVIDASKPPVFDWKKIWDGIEMYLFKKEEMTDVFPFQGYGGTFVTFPILYAFLLGLIPPVYRVLREKRLRFFSVSLLVTAVFVCAQDVFWSPTFYQRYRLDYQYLLGILAFLMIGIFIQILNGKTKTVVSFIFCLIGLITIFECFVLWMIPGDANFSYAYPEILEKIQKILMMQG